MSIIINSRSDLEALRGNAVYADALRYILGSTTTWINEAQEGEAPIWKQVSVGDTLAHLDLTLEELLQECAAAGIAPSNLPEPISAVASKPVPLSVPLWAVRVVLAEQGLLDQANAAITASDNTAIKVIWEYGNFADRASPSMNALGEALGLTQEQLDQMFIDAVSLTV